MFCRERCVVKNQDHVVIVEPLRCRCWHCDLCRPGRKARLVEEAQRGAPLILVTLTSKRRPDRSEDWAAQELVKCWRLIRRRYIQEHGPGSLPFLAVFEATKRGWPHLHIVVRAKWISQRWLSEQMGELHGSPIVDVRRVQGLRKVAHYIAKYIGKNPHRFNGVKRYWRSLDYLAPPADEEQQAPKEGATWEAIDCPVLQMQTYLERGGFAGEVRRGKGRFTYTVPP